MHKSKPRQNFVFVNNHISKLVDDIELKKFLLFCWSWIVLTAPLIIRRIKRSFFRMNKSVSSIMWSKGSDNPLTCSYDGDAAVDVITGLQCVVDTHHWCLKVDEKSEDIFSVSDYFYPFSIEFSILVVAIWYVMWSHIGQIHDHHQSMDFLPETETGRVH